MNCSENLVHLDVGYRLMVVVPVQYYAKRGWYGRAQSYGGRMGFWPDVRGVKESAKSNGIKKGTYEIWKFHIGLPNSEVQWFPPTKVYPE